MRSMQALLFLFLVCAGVSGCSHNNAANKTYTVGVVNFNPELDKIFHGFRAYMTRLGYINNKNITYLYNGPSKNIEELNDNLDLLVERKVDLILAITTPAARLAKQKTAESGIPVVFAPVFDPVNSGIVESLVKPGGNITGIKVGGNVEKALDWLLKIVPHTRTIYVPACSEDQATKQSLLELQQAAAKFKVQLLIREVNKEKELAAVLANIPPGVDALWLLNSHFLVTYTPLYVTTSIKFKLPLGSSTFQVEDGILVSYGQNAFRTGELAASLADDILQGSSPSELPVETTDYFLGINLKTAQAIGIDISDDILHVANTIIRP